MGTMTISIALCPIEHQDVLGTQKQTGAICIAPVISYLLTKLVTTDATDPARIVQEMGAVHGRDARNAFSGRFPPRRDYDNYRSRS